MKISCIGEFTMMKKRLFVLVCIGILCFTGCQSSEEKRQAEIMESFESMGVEYEAVIMTVLSKSWKVTDSEDIYEFTKEGTGNLSGKEFTYTCGFSDDHDIMLQIIMNDTEEKLNYFVSTDETGYGLYIESPENGKVIHLLQSNVELLDITDERAEFFVGEWADKGDNRYVLREDFTMVIKGAERETEGTYSVAIRDDKPVLMLVFGSNTLEFEYELLKDQTTVKLQAPGTDNVHTWIKK